MKVRASTAKNSHDMRVYLFVVESSGQITDFHHFLRMSKIVK